MSIVLANCLELPILLFVFADVVLSNDLDWMSAGLLLLHEYIHVLWWVTLVNKECA